MKSTWGLLPVKLFRALRNRFRWCYTRLKAETEVVIASSIQFLKRKTEHRFSKSDQNYHWVGWLGGGCSVARTCGIALRSANGPSFSGTWIGFYPQTLVLTSPEQPANKPILVHWWIATNIPQNKTNTYNDFLFGGRITNSKNESIVAEAFPKCRSSRTLGNKPAGDFPKWFQKQSRQGQLARGPKTMVDGWRAAGKAPSF